MNLVIEVPDAPIEAWVAILSKQIDDAGLRAALAEVRAPPGTLGAQWKPKIRTTLETAADAAGVLSLIVALYALQPSKPAACEIRLSQGMTSTALVIPCEDARSPKSLEMIVKAFDQFGSTPPEVVVTPSPTPRIE